MFIYLLYALMYVINILTLCMFIISTPYRAKQRTQPGWLAEVLGQVGPHLAAGPGPRPGRVRQEKAGPERCTNNTNANNKKLTMILMIIKLLTIQ